jgi:solute carrier family 35 protein E3
MKAFAAAGIYEKKVLPTRALVPLAAAYVGYIVLNNLNLQLNTVGFYQITKIAVAPAVLAAEAAFFGKRSSPRVTASIGVVCIGVGLATVTDPQVGAGVAGLAVGAGAVAATAAYQIWAGTKQKELGAGSMQLLDQYAPLAAGMLGALVLGVEPVGLASPGPDTLLGFDYTPAAVAAIAVSAVLGLLVSLSTFLVIGATSSLTYNVVGHVKTVIILAGGCIFFGDEMPAKKLAGISVAMGGIVWYSQLKLAESAAATAAGGLPVAKPPSPRALGRVASAASLGGAGNKPAVA